MTRKTINRGPRGAPALLRLSFALDTIVALEAELMALSAGLGDPEERKRLLIRINAAARVLESLMLQLKHDHV